MISTTQSRSSGKERDSDTGLDYFGARYHSGMMGRFTSPDPSRWSIRQNPQSWNLYSYVLNDPVNAVDRNGQWPWYVHNRIIDDAFRGVIPDKYLPILKNASADVDAPQNQTPERSFMHGMSGPWGETRRLASIQSENFITTNLGDAVKAQLAWEKAGNDGLSPDAIYAFGKALHTRADMFTPAHAGFQQWNGEKGIGNRMKEAQHVGSDVLEGATNDEAQYDARVAASLLWIRFQAQLERERKKEKEDKDNEEGIILVGPDASNPQFWNTKDDGPAFLRDVIEDLKAKCSVDAQRLYLFGHSAGASYGLMIAMLESGYFAAAAVHAGALHEEEYRMLGYASRKIPIAVWSGNLDRSIPIDAVEATVAEMKRQQFPAELNVMRGHDHNYYMVSDDVNRAAWDFLKAKKNDNPQFKEWQFE